jgi:hypothetical protein
VKEGGIFMFWTVENCRHIFMKSRAADIVSPNNKAIKA